MKPFTLPSRKAIFASDSPMSLKAPGARKKPDPEAEKTQFQERNRLAVGVVLAAGGGFLAAMYLGAFSGSEMRDVPSWLSALTSVVAAGISALAVFLVAQTLKETRKTLDATREMASDQKRIGDAQIRPYLLEVDSHHESWFAEQGYAELAIEVKNFGVTPASSIRVDFELEASMFEDIGDPNGPMLISRETERTDSCFEQVFPPGFSGKFSQKYLASDLAEGFEYWVHVAWKYYSHDNKVPYSGATSFLLRK